VTAAGTVEEAVAAIRAGRLIVFPADTVYGLACTPYREAPVQALSELKGLPPGRPIALVAASVDTLLECVPELRGRAGVIARSLLPGPYTLVVPNPACRFPWLTGAWPDTIGVRVPELEGPGRELLDGVYAVAATSANRHGEPDPRRLDDVPPEFLAAASALDGGELPGRPSTVLDVTASEARVLREGAIPAAEALARIESVLA
jgi:L-threonylcarbamoyladenylate synthase